MDNNQQYILSCIDGSSYSESVCDYASWIARVVNAPLNFLHTIEQQEIPAVSDLSGSIGLGASEDLLNELTEVEQNRRRLLIKKGNIMLQAAKQKAQAAGVSDIELTQQHGNIAAALVEREEQIRVAVVGIGGEQQETGQHSIGTQLEMIIRSLHKPILVVNKAFSIPEKIMLAYDGGDAANKALQMVASSPLFKNIPCHLVHVVNNETTTADQLLDEAANLLRNSGIAVTTAKLSGKIEEALAAYQAQLNIDLTLMGAFSHTRVRNFLLGSFTAKMLNSTQKPLLLLR